MSAATQTRGTLYLIPTPLAEPVSTRLILPEEVLAITRRLNYFIAENAKTARAFLRAVDIGRPIQEISIQEIDKHAAQQASDEWLAPLLAGHDMGLVSEAGAPAVADPGANIVAVAHRLGVRVAPLVGPSSLLLALMASGLNGQRFAFHGYLPQDKALRAKAIADLERESRQKQQTQMCIETPYRNQALLGDLLATLAPRTRLCVAVNVTSADEEIRSRTVADWRKQAFDMGKRPALFLFLA